MAGLVAVVLWPRPPAVPQDIALPVSLRDGPLWITVFGTSLSAVPQTWPDRLGARLTACRGAPVHVARVAGPGMGSGWATGQVGRVVATAPDLVLIEFAINDADLRDGVSMALSRQQHIDLIAALRNALPGSQIALMTMSPAQGPRGWIRPRLAAHYDQYRSLATTERLGLIDVHPRWLALPRDRRGLEADGLHPDPAVADRIMTGAVAGYLGCPQPS